MLFQCLAPPCLKCAASLVCDDGIGLSDLPEAGLGGLA